MRDVRKWVLVGVLVALAILVVGATQHVRAIRASLLESETRRLRADLQAYARLTAASLDRELSTHPTSLHAIYSLEGELIYPAPPAEARPWEPPHGTLSALFLRQGDFEHAWEAAASSADRAAVLVARGTHGNDSKDLRAALEEPALKGTDLSYRVRLQILRLEQTPTDDWSFETYLDSLFALRGGPSDDLAHALLKEAVGQQERHRTHTWRQELMTLKPHEDPRVHKAWVQRFERVDDRWHLKRMPVLGLHLEEPGEIAEPLPAPFSNLVVRADIDEDALDAAVQRETRLVVGLYGMAGLLLIVGTVYSIKATGRALRLARDQSDFVANVTHELKTPLANVQLYAESLREGRVKPEDRDAFLDTILEESRRLDGLVEGLLHAARGAKITRSRVDTRALVEQAAARWRPRLEEEGFEFEVELGPSVEVSADAEALQRALDNLLDNARKYSRDDRRIHLSGTCNDGLARLTVRDHGPGIPVQDRKRVLEPFTRLESADRKETPGTGLGLSLAAACMAAHGGRVEISENSGAGSAVSLVLVLEGVR